MSEALTDTEEELLRQVHPTHLTDDGEPLRTAFTPTKKDEGRLSTLRGHVAPEEAYRRHIARDLLSAGTWSVTVGDASDAGCSALDDGDELDVPDHASIDFTEIDTRKGIERAARKLRDAAVQRGCRFAPPSP